MGVMWLADAVANNPVQVKIYIPPTESTLFPKGSSGESPNLYDSTPVQTLEIV